MNTILFIIQILLILIYSSIGAYTGYMQSVTLYLGKKIARPGIEKDSPRGLQDAVTPKIQENLLMTNIILVIILFILGTYLYWYLGIISVLVGFLLRYFFKMFMPNKMDHYYSVVQHHLINKLADYRRDNDSMRMGATGEIIVDLNQIYEDEIKNKNMSVPNILDVKEMSF